MTYTTRGGHPDHTSKLSRIALPLSYRRASMAFFRGLITEHGPLCDFGGGPFIEEERGCLQAFILFDEVQICKWTYESLVASLIITLLDHVS